MAEQKDKNVPDPLSLLEPMFRDAVREASQVEKVVNRPIAKPEVVPKPDPEAIVARHMLGTCSNGYERNSGRLSHAVKGYNETALCGASPGRRSVGWSDYADEAVTCKRCLKKMEKLG